MIDYKNVIELTSGEELIDNKLKLATIKFITRDFKGAAYLTSSILKINPLHELVSISVFVLLLI